MSKVRLTGSNSGYVEIAAAADAGNLTFTMPTSGTALLGNTGNVFSGITTTGQLDINGSIDVSSTSVFNDDVTLTGGSYNVVWDKSDNQLEFGDNAKLSFGGQADMRLFHDGTNSVITNATGDLYINNNADTIIKPANDCFIKPQDGENGISVIGNGAVELYFNNSKKIETTNTGAVVSGICTATSFSGSGENLTRTTQLSHRNLIINGAMQVAQRSTSAVTIPGGKTVTDVDRFGQWSKVSEGNWKTGQQVADAPAGFQYSRKITSLAANTLASNSYHSIRYAVEGFDAAQLNCGNSSAKTVTLSFYVKSSLTGSFGMNFTNSANNRSYPVPYTISSANTWEQKTITLTLDTSGTWLTNNGVGLEINWKLAMGSGYDSGSPNQWQNTWKFPENTVNLLTTNGATFQLTGVQLEVGQQATPFEHRSFSDELNRCSRYLQIFHVPTSDSKRASNITATVHGTGSGVYLNVAFIHPMRAAPSVTVDGAFGGNVFTGSWSGATLSGITAEYGTDALSTLGFHGITSASVTGSHTTGLTGQIYTANNGSNDAALIYSAEL